MSDQDCGCGCGGSGGCGGDCGQPSKTITIEKQGSSQKTFYKGDDFACAIDPTLDTNDGDSLTVVLNRLLSGLCDVSGRIDRYGYYATSDTPITLPLSSSTFTMDIGVDKAFVIGDYIRVTNPDNGDFFVAQVSEYRNNPLSPDYDLIRLSYSSSIHKSVFTAEGTFSDWVVTLESEKTLTPDSDYDLIFSAKKYFSDSATTYIPISDDDPFRSYLSGGVGHKMTFDSTDPDVVIETEKLNNYVDFDDINTGVVSFLNAGFKFRFIQLDLLIPMEATGLNKDGDPFITPSAGSGSISLMVDGHNPTASTNYTNDAAAEAANKTVVTERTKSISMSVKIPYAQYQAQTTGGGGGTSQVGFTIQNATDLAIKGGDYSVGGTTVQGYYGIKVFI